MPTTLYTNLPDHTWHVRGEDIAFTDGQATLSVREANAVSDHLTYDPQETKYAFTDIRPAKPAPKAKSRKKASK